MQQRWWSVGPVHKDASSKCWAQCLERINRHISLSLLFFFSFYIRRNLSQNSCGFYASSLLFSPQLSAGGCVAVAPLWYRFACPRCAVGLLAQAEHASRHLCSPFSVLLHSAWGPGGSSLVLATFFPLLGPVRGCWVSVMEEGPSKQSVIPAAQGFRGSGPTMGLLGISLSRWRKSALETPEWRGSPAPQTGLMSTGQAAQQVLHKHHVLHCETVTCLYYWLW